MKEGSVIFLNIDCLRESRSFLFRQPEPSRVKKNRLRLIYTDVYGFVLRYFLGPNILNVEVALTLLRH